jgi:hypothetical protein
VFYVYLHRRLDTMQPFYVGKGSGKRAGVKTTRNIWWHRVVEKAGFKPEIISYWKSETDALEHERFIIACFRDMGINLTNIEDGGLPGPIGKGQPKSEEHKAKIAASHKGKKKTPHTPEAREKARLRQTGKKMPLEAKLKIADANRRRVLSEETKAKISATKLLRSAKNGNQH